MVIVGRHTSMSFRVQVVRLLAATLIATTACVFVSFYNWASGLTVERGVPLAAITRHVVEYCPYAYAVPVLVLGAGIALLRGRRDPGIAIEIVLAFAWIAAFAWVLLTIWCWQIMRIEIMNHVRI
jgi:hypothetical protein